MRSYVSIILVKLFRKLSLQDDKTSEKINSKFSEYIKNHSGERITLSVVAKEFLYNPSYFSRLFKNYFGMTFSEYVSRERIEKAGKMLRESDMSVSEIAAEAGFSNMNMFYKKFREYKGCLPAEYRKK